MTGSAVSLSGIGKRYDVPAGPPITNVTDGLMSVLGRRGRKREFWALRDVSFELEHGETVGIVGSNGAGKSTLLRILARITDPTTGSGSIRGRVTSLIEIGTGFHGELSGRDNVFMNGALLGMRRAEIKRKFDEIVAFSGVEAFIDMPVKRYSTGMYLRLAFAVAAHVEPEVMLVDEALSVGDVSFQDKCLGRMDELARAGATVLFVSHSLASVARLCTRGLVLQQGRLVFDGPVDAAVESYRALQPAAGSAGKLDVQHRDGTGLVRFVEAVIAGRSGGLDIPAGAPVSIDLVLESQRPIDWRNIELEVRIEDEAGTVLATLSTRLSGDRASDGVARTTCAASCDVDSLPFRPGRYLLTLAARRLGETLDRVPRQLELPIGESDFFGSGMLPQPAEGPVLLAHSWRSASDALRLA